MNESSFTNQWLDHTWNV